ncbi:DUF1642 domain-containing protein [Enterococcus faecium]|uniref:DUF1642 domain-containing protein n=1 Tax=Enterococcus faecium TaxID=1352 RepID=UPI000CF3352D|nr:DUF1642 domain-containing protein [Enterococcus faecium]NTR68651.1 DUF1642 domain-containing protein [Enterococcus faecium]NTS03740.1 DUF1642 domain-containing protein [Enterococcus faecium]PQG67080.1 hypothetical protein CUS63_09395 [Enterococcus faecium]TQA82989.1 DUF1642 domain-containing protein [Enterococcus faecium]TQB06118.1 DUF1642 domain-containing protein [Enterococcus faecium]
MNKKELIDKQELINEQAWNKVAEAYPESAQSLRNTLDNAVFGKTGEPQKPVVPKFVADWIELCKEKADLISCLSGSYEYGVNQYKRITEDEDWLFEADHQELVARAWLYSYEVEKEPLYRVKIGEGYFVEYQGRGALIMPDCNKEIKIFDSKSDAERTAQTIGGTVEEVVEG